mgnify:CR=1 FL=1
MTRREADLALGTQQLARDRDNQMADEGAAQRESYIGSADSLTKIRKKVHTDITGPHPSIFMNWIAKTYPSQGEAGPIHAAAQKVLTRMKTMFETMECTYCGAPHGTKRCKAPKDVQYFEGNSSEVKKIFSQWVQYDQIKRLNDPEGNADNMARTAKYGGRKRDLKSRKKRRGALTSEDEE